MLQEALAIQTGLMADDPSLAVADEVQLCQQGDCCGSLNARDSSWGFHSPLMYWNCSSQLIHDDLDKVATVNKEATRQSFQNVTLRPTSVFAGKYFSGKRLIAADAIVLTLYHRSDHEVGRAWDRRARQLAQSNAARWTFYPATGFTSRNQVYEFHFQQMTLREDLYLAMAYTVMIIYVIVSVSRLRAVKSQLGLLVTALLQVGLPSSHAPPRIHSHRPLGCSLHCCGHHDLRYSSDKPFTGSQGSLSFCRSCDRI